ncbi:MAG: hypothetical protein SOR80_03970 [Enterococcus cecorum]|nr:hypothetical protein [Enterococcus cecorum]
MGLLSKHLEKNCESQLAGELNFSVQEAYRYLHELINANPILKRKEMNKSLGHIRQGLVDVALDVVLSDSPIKSDVQMIPAKNNTNGYTYSMIEVKGAIISPVKVRNRKYMPRKAVHRSTASVLNRQFDLFYSQEDINEEYSKDTPPFILLTYGDKNHQLEFVQLGLPDVSTEKWIDRLEISNVPRLQIADGKQEETRKKLDLTLTAYSEDLLRREINGENKI